MVIPGSFGHDNDQKAQKAIFFDGFMWIPLLHYSLFSTYFPRMNWEKIANCHRFILGSKPCPIDPRLLVPQLSMNICKKVDSRTTNVQEEVSDEILEEINQQF